MRYIRLIISLAQQSWFCCAGRTMDFIFDQSQLPIIGSRYWDIVPTIGTQSMERDKAIPSDSLTGNQSRRTNISGTETNSSSSGSDMSSWRRPLASQVGLDFQIHKLTSLVHSVLRLYYCCGVTFQYHWPFSAVFVLVVWCDLSMPLTLQYCGCIVVRWPIVAWPLSDVVQINWMNTLLYEVHWYK